MALARISSVKPLYEFQLEIILTSGEVVQPDLCPLLTGPVVVLFVRDSIRKDHEQFRLVRAEERSLVWPGGLEPCPDVVA